MGLPQPDITFSASLRLLSSKAGKKIDSMQVEASFVFIVAIRRGEK